MRWSLYHTLCNAHLGIGLQNDGCTISSRILCSNRVRRANLTALHLAEITALIFADNSKTYLASALGDRACRQGFKVMYFTMNNLVEQLRLVHLEGRQTHFLRKLANQDLLIIDDFGMQKLQSEIQNDVEQIVDDRYKEKSLILASLLPVSDWYRVFQCELIADAFMDRVSHTELRFTLQGDSLRKKY